MPNASPYVKDSINDYLLHGKANASILTRRGRKSQLIIPSQSVPGNPALSACASVTGQ